VIRELSYSPAAPHLPPRPPNPAPLPQQGPLPDAAAILNASARANPEASPAQAARAAAASRAIQTEEGDSDRSQKALDRPDLLVKFPNPASNPPTLIDVAVVAPWSLGSLRRGSDRKQFAAAHATVQTKNNRYKNLVNELRQAILPNLQFHGFVVESTGAIPPASISLLRSWAQRCAERKRGDLPDDADTNDILAGWLIRLHDAVIIGNHEILCDFTQSKYSLLVNRSLMSYIERTHPTIISNVRAYMGRHHGRRPFVRPSGFAPVSRARGGSS